VSPQKIKAAADRRKPFFGSFGISFCFPVRMESGTRALYLTDRF
jgi:hypothetical protein